MLRNDPPPMTRVRFVKSVRQAKQSDTADLLGPVKQYDVDHPGDLFRVSYQDAVMEVRRDDIEEVE